MKTKDNYIELAVNAAKLAAAAIVEIYDSGDFGVTIKEDYSPLTLADKASHTIISEQLKITGIPVLSEEGKEISYAERSKWSSFWLVDPLDGTKEFVKRNGEFTVNIALIENNKPVWGVVCAPVLNKTYYIDSMGDVWMEWKNKKCKLSKREIEYSARNESVKVVASRSHGDLKTDAFLENLNNPQIVSMGSSLKFMMLAEGLAHVYPRFAPTMEWDTAASHAILNKLGYKILVENSNQELMYNKESLLNPGFIAF